MFWKKKDKTTEVFENLIDDFQDIRDEIEMDDSPFDVYQTYQTTLKYILWDLKTNFKDTVMFTDLFYSHEFWIKEIYRFKDSFENNIVYQRSMKIKKLKEIINNQ
ncbi:hypothetical protein [Carboxylicivirga sp. RSCT41]|uniref:hypothetical protein n=1 Tax=Carboxylicivirga agarovorans TaxID=3417570 RepID=UPI003D34349C